jgi:hypothetical protein
MRRRVGWFLLGLSVIGAVALLDWGRPFVSAAEVHRNSYPDGSFSESAIMEVRLSYIVTVVVGVAGLGLIFMSRSEKSSG